MKWIKTRVLVSPVLSAQREGQPRGKEFAKTRFKLRKKAFAHSFPCEFRLLQIVQGERLKGVVDH